MDDEQMYEFAGDCPWNQSADLDFEQARADWERARQADGWADYVADMAERQAADDAEQLELLAGDERAQAGYPVRRGIGMTHTWYVRKAGSRVHHPVSVPVGDERRELSAGMPDAGAGRSACGLAVGSFDMWSWGGTYFGGEPLPLCGRCRKAGQR